MQEQTTLGGRIQEGRRAAGLSQEALGERLGVSRQAVSKWESDAAVPELENLIAMSRLFAVSVGRLLGVEPEDPGGEVPREGLTDRELQAAEAIAAKYAEAAGQGARRRYPGRREGLLCSSLGIFMWRNIVKPAVQLLTQLVHALLFQGRKGF
ncbi:helix-turn-helix transcriptional regulator, partial [uncultured Oscillibacter sp.]|uniref:helix-turn-helix domain-containing protein n=1 Tax=uncultured Oscillibacter sp. TaxID=876091 RepID=UPI0034519E5C